MILRRTDARSPREIAVTVAIKKNLDASGFLVLTEGWDSSLVVQAEMDYTPPANTIKFNVEDIPRVERSIPEVNTLSSQGNLTLGPYWHH